MKKTSLRYTFYTLLIAVISIFSVLPFYVMIVMGTYQNEDLFKKIVLVPGSYFLQNLHSVMQTDFGLIYWNSILVSVLSTILCVLVSTMAGFAFANSIVLLTMMIPGQLGLVAYIIEMRFMSLTDTFLPLVLPWVANAFGVYWMTQFMKGAIPTEVLESARIDGCSEISTFFRIALPFTLPAVTTLSLLVFLWSWNNYLLPLIIINDPDRYTIPLGITNLGNAYRTDLAAQILGLSLGTLPVLVLFALGSKSFIRGLTAGSVKG